MLHGAEVVVQHTACTGYRFVLVRRLTILSGLVFKIKVSSNSLMYNFYLYSIAEMSCARAAACDTSGNVIRNYCLSSRRLCALSFQPFPASAAQYASGSAGLIAYAFEETCRRTAMAISVVVLTNCCAVLSCRCKRTM